MSPEPVRVLVAEDNVDHQFLTLRALRSVEGVEVDAEAVSDGEAALDFVYQRGAFADRARPHLILLDLKMPKINGLEVLERLKEDAELRTIPVVVLTSSERPEDVSATYDRGGNCYVTKPAGPGVLRDLTALSRFWTGVATLPEPTL
jgi:CheY-like chemotaxis protein